MRGIRTGLTAILATLSLAGVATGCGGGSAAGEGVATAGGDAKTVNAKTQSDPQQAGLDFARCMREHGVDMEDPVAGEPGKFSVQVGGGPESSHSEHAAVAGHVVPADDEAFEACRHFLDDAIGSGDVKIDPEMQDRALKFSQCMRDHGVDMPDPQFSGGGIRMEIGGSIDPSSPTFQAAQEACNQYFGPPGGGGGGGGKGKGGFVTSGPVAKGSAS